MFEIIKGTLKEKEDEKVQMKEKIETLLKEITFLRKEKKEPTVENELQSSVSREVSKQLRDLPYVMVCANKAHWETPDRTITYDSLLSNYTNAERPNGGDGHFDIKSGKFTCLTPG